MATASAQRAVIFDASSLTWEERVTVEALQGLVNRAGPRLYLNHGDVMDRNWPGIYHQRAGLEYEPMRGMKALLARFGSSAGGFVVYDPELDGSRYVAVTLAGVEGLLPVAPAVLEGRTPAMRLDGDWPGADFTAADPAEVADWRLAAGATLKLEPGKGLWLQEANPTPGQFWSFISLGALSIDLGRYPILEADVPALEGDNACWGIKLTWDRKGDGQISGPEDDLVLPFPAKPGVLRWDIGKLSGIHGPHTFAYIQLHVAGQGARVLWRRVRFIGRDGAQPAPQPVTALTGPGLPIRRDLRGMFSKSVDAYDWALREVMPRCNRRFAHAVNGMVEGIRAGGGPMPGFDWPVMQKGFVFNLTCAPTVMGSYGDSKVGGSPEQATMYGRIVAALEPPAQVNGYGEPEDVWCRLLSQHGDYSMHAFYNWSFHNRVPGPPLSPRQKVHFTADKVQPETDRFYVCFMTSEGDTMKGPLPFFFGSWFEKERGSVPMNWGINPLMGRQFSAMLQYYYDTATPNDYFFAGCSGAGYCYPDDMPNVAQFAAHTERACREADIRVLDLWGASRQEVLARYAQWTKPLGITLNAGPARLKLLSGGTPVATHELAYWQGVAIPGDYYSAMLDNAKRAQAVKWVVARIEDIARRHTPPFIILVYSDLHNYAHHCQLHGEIARALDPARFKPARLDEAFAGIRAWSRDRVMVGGDSLSERLQWAALAGVPTRIPLTVTNGRAEAAAARVEMSAGEARAEADLQLAPHETRELTGLKLLAGPQTPDKGRLVISTAGKQQAQEVGLTVVPCDATPPAEASFARQWSAVSLSHRSGQSAPDPQALGGAAWASPSAPAPGDHIIYGPYAQLPPGRYLVMFRAKLAPGAQADGEAPVATFDLFTGGYEGTAKTVSERTIRRSDFAAPDRWQWFSLEGAWPGPPSLMETRVFWHGRVGVLVDRVVVFGVK